jgi:prevent-host-death family protein
MSEQVSIGRVKRDISELVNRVAYGGERIILTSRGKPKAALVGMADFEKLQGQGFAQQARMLAWMKETRTLADEILARRGGEPIDVDDLLSTNRRELDERSDWLSHRD